MSEYKHPRAWSQQVDLVAGLHSCWSMAGRGLRSHGTGLFPASQADIAFIGTTCLDTANPT